MMKLIGDPRVAVLVPVRDTVDTFWAYDYARMLVTTAHKRPRIKLYPMMMTGASLSRQREGLADSVLSMTDATHLMWLDSDMRFPADTLLRLLAHNVPAVCASYTSRGTPFTPQAYTDPLNWDKRVWPTPEATGLREIVAAGFGCVLFERHVFETVQKPRFCMPYIEAPDHTGQMTAGYMQEDLFFFLKMREAGIALMLDQDLTKQVAHIGRFEFTPEHAIRFAEQNGVDITSDPVAPAIPAGAPGLTEGDDLAGPTSNQ
jgi:hypothetical protein